MVQNTVNCFVVLSEIYYLFTKEDFPQSGAPVTRRLNLPSLPFSDISPRISSTAINVPA